MATATLLRPKAKRLWTFDELVAELPETTTPTELWDGELIMAPAPRPNHQRAVARFWRLLHEHVSRNDLGEAFISPLDVVLSARRVVQPDVVFISKSRSDIVQDYIRGIPDLVVEVISEGSWRRDRVEKKNLYEQLGLPEYWIVDPESQTIEVFVLEQGSYRIHARAELGQTAASRIVPGFSVTWQQLSA
jgi:Uma2 family endonuclease